MKAILLMLLAALLCGCTQQPQPTQPTRPVVEPTQPTQPKQLLIAGELGDFRYYDAPEAGVAAFAPMAEGYALVTVEGTAVLLQGRELEVIKTRDLGCALQPDDPSVLIGDDQLSYFDPERDAYVTLGKNLTEISAITIRDEVIAGPIMSADRSLIYYCTEAGLRSMDIPTGNSRLLRQEHHRILSLDALLFDGSILRYTYCTETGGTEVCFVRTADGSGVYLAQLNGEIVTWGQSYAAQMNLPLPMGTERQIVTGQVGGEVQLLNVGDQWTKVDFTGGCALVQSQWQQELALRVYDLHSGSRIAETRLTGAPYTGALLEEGGMWLWSAESGRFLFWSFDRAETDSYLVSQPTLSNPDTSADQALQQRLQRLSDAYHVTVRIVQGENRTGGVDYSGYPDCRAAQYTKAVDALEEAMSVLPYNILSGLHDERNLVIELVDDFDPAHGVRPGTGSLTIGGETVLRVSMCQELPYIFYHELFHAMDVQIHSCTDKLTEWDDVNPEGFTYAGSYSAYQRGELDESPFAAAFPDAYARISAREDRAQTFMYAMLEGHEALFESEEMQQKLQILDDAIRIAFGYSKAQDTYRWEQYQK